MNSLRKYDIDIARLVPGRHEFQYQIDDSFFELFDYSLVDKGSLTVDVLLDKEASFISLIFEFRGSVELTCDRSLDPFDFEMSTKQEIVLKFGDEAREVSDEMEIIPFKTQNINVARYIYELISVQIPMKKLHPRYKDDLAEDQIIFSSDDEERENQVDPRWNQLKKLKNKDNN